MTQQFGRNYKDTLPIFRYQDYELDEAIENLEGRGYVLVDRGEETKITSKRYWARLRKVDNTSEIAPSVSSNTF